MPLIWVEEMPPAVKACTHTVEHSEWVESENRYTGEIEGEWFYETRSTCEDFGVGRFRCTQCGWIGYYTGLWKDFYEKGIPCPGSTGIRAATAEGGPQ